MTMLSPSAASAAALDQAWSAIAAAGGWFDGTERVAIARATREARDCALCRARKDALSPNAVAGAHDGAAGPLSEAVVDAIHRIASDPGRLSHGWYAQAQAAGLPAEEVVEITGVVALVSIVDTYLRGLGRPLRALPTPAAGTPHRTPATGAVLDRSRGWVPMVDPAAAEGTTKLLFEGVQSGAGFVFNVARALTAVPEAARDFFFLIFPHYSTHGEVREGGLDRVQVELLASTTSAWNDCFY